jgi:hypothetical protein
MIGGRKRRFCSSVPCAMSVGPTRFTPIRLMTSGARVAAISSWKT